MVTQTTEEISGKDTETKAGDEKTVRLKQASDVAAEAQETSEKAPDGKAETTAQEEGTTEEQQEKTYLQSEHEKLVQEALKKTQSSFSKQIKELREELHKKTKEHEELLTGYKTREEKAAQEAEEKSVKSKLEESGVDSDSIDYIIKTRRSLADETKRIEQRDTEFEKKVKDFEDSVVNVRQTNKRNIALNYFMESEFDSDSFKEFQKLSEDFVKLFDECKDEKGMELVYYKYLANKGKEESEAKSKEKPVQKTDSGKTKGGGNMSFTRDQIADFDFFVKNKEAILKAQREGRIKD